MKGMKILSRWLSVSLLVVVSCLPVRAAPPQTISYQGFLTSSAGAPVNATLSVQFSLYSVASGGTALWTETQSVTVTNGNYSVILGNTTPISLPFDAPYFLGVTVGTDAEMTPRAALTIVPYAFRAITADTAVTANTATTATTANALAGTATVLGSQVTGALSTATIGGPQITGAITGATLPSTQLTGQIAPTQLGAGTAAINISGNAATATSVATATLAGGFTGTLSGDVTGTQAATAVVAIRGTGVAATAPAANQFLGFNGTTWTPMNVSGSQITGAITTATIDGTQITGGITTATVAGSQITGTITNATIPGVAPWVTVSGTSQQAVSNTSYLVIGSSLATITLPASPVAGDVIKVSGQGAGGFTIVPGAGQAIFGGQFVPGGTWIARETYRSWASVASSADGVKLVAAENYGAIYTSSDSGVTWFPQSAGGMYWRSLASDADGVKLVAVEYFGGIFTSTDSGISWTLRPYTGSWTSVASSSDGVKLAAADGSQLGQIYTSTNSGATWTPGGPGDGFWQAVASSSDGTKLVAATSNGGIYTSTDSGANWSLQPNAGSRSWQSVASSADGTKLVAAVGGGQIYTSANGGVDWIERTSAGSRSWRAVATSADGMRLVAVAAAEAGGDAIYVSADNGMTWTARESNRQWGAVASSANGTKLVAAVSGGQIYTSAPATTITGGQYSAAELVFGGNAQWLLVSQNGALTTP